MHVKRATESHYWGVNIGSGNGLVQSGNNSLPDPVLTQIYDAIRRHNPHLVKLHLLDNEKKLQLWEKHKSGQTDCQSPILISIDKNGYALGYMCGIFYCIYSGYWAV